MKTKLYLACNGITRLDATGWAHFFASEPTFTSRGKYWHGWSLLDGDPTDEAKALGIQPGECRAVKVEITVCPDK